MEAFFQNLRYLPYRIDPVAFRIGFIQVRYYGIMLLTAFLSVYGLVSYRLKKEKIGISKEVVDNYLFWVLVALIAGGRLGYVLFYNLAYYLRNPLEVILPFRLGNGFEFIGLSGLSYHGSLIGIALATIVFCRKHKVNLWRLADLFSAAVPLGHFFGRIGNFLNGELYGRVTSVAWGMYFPADAGNLARHPSQLYQAFFEGLVLFILLWSFRKKIKTPGLIFCFYLIGYGFLRFLVEFFRQPDPQLGFVLGPFSMGQILSFLMILVGFSILGLKQAKH